MKTLAFSKWGGVYLPINLKPIKNQNKMKKLIYSSFASDLGRRPGEV